MDAPAELTAMLQRSVRSLDEAGVPDEALAALKHRRVGGDRLVPAGRAWRLGVLLLDRSATLYATGEVTRAVEPLRGVTNRSAEAEARRAVRHLAARSRFPEGEVVNFGHAPVGPGDELLPIVDGVILVRWSGSFTRPLADYLADRVALLVDAATGR